MQVALGVLVIFFALYLHVSYSPYCKQELDKAEKVSLASSIVTLVCGLLLLNESTTRAWMSLATAMVFFVQVGFAIYIVMHMIWASDMKEKIQGSKFFITAQGSLKDFQNWRASAPVLSAAILRKSVHVPFPWSGFAAMAPLISHCGLLFGPNTICGLFPHPVASPLVPSV